MGLLCAEQNVGNLKNCTLRKSGTPVRRTKRRKSRKLHFQKFEDSCAQTIKSEISKNALSEVPRLLIAVRNVGNLTQYTFRHSGTPVRRTKRRKYPKLHFPEFWDFCEENKTSEISTNALSEIMGLLCAEQHVGNLNQMHVQEFWHSSAQNKPSEI